MHAHVHKSKRGFSLMELMVVIAILGILSTLVVTNVIPMFAKGKTTKAQNDVKALQNAVQMYLFNNNKLPDSLDVLVQPDPKNNGEGYLGQETVPLDPWDGMYIYEKMGGSKFEIKTLGADGLIGGEGENDDISSRDLGKGGSAGS